MTMHLSYRFKDSTHLLPLRTNYPYGVLKTVSPPHEKKNPIINNTLMQMHERIEKKNNDDNILIHIIP